MPQPSVTILVVNYNGSGVVEKCIDSIFQSKYKKKEVVVIDNGSVDGSPQILRKKYAEEKRFKLIRLKENMGPALARNIAMKGIKSKYVAFLDNDTVVHKDWLIEPIKRMEEDATVASCQSKLLMAYDHKVIDYVGDYISQFGFLVQKAAGGEIDNGQYDSNFEILSAKSAGMILRRSAFERVGGFDPDYFIFVEETDLGWRFWLAGYRNIFTPTSVVFHEYGTTAKRFPNEQNYRAKFHGSKNYIATLFKCLSIKNLFLFLPIHISLWIGMALWFFIKGLPLNGFWILKGIAWNLFHLFSQLKKRDIIQRKRKITDAVLFEKIMERKSLSYFYNKLVGRPSMPGVKGYSQK
jgi:hypothetical protein